MNSWSRHKQRASAHDASHKKWRAVAKREGPEMPWSSGQEYVRMWKEGVRPTYIPVVTEPEITPEGLQAVAAEEARNRDDFMGLVN